MTAVLLFAFVAGADAVPKPSLTRVVEDETLVAVIDRSLMLTERLLNELPEGERNSPRERIQLMLSDTRRDAANFAKHGTYLFEASCLFTYSDLCRMASVRLGDQGLKMPVNPARHLKPDLIRLGAQGNPKSTHVETLLSNDDLKELDIKTRSLLDGLRARPKLDPIQNGKWQRDLTKLGADLKQAENEYIDPRILSKTLPEAKVLGLHARLVALTVATEK